MLQYVAVTRHRSCNTLQHTHMYIYKIPSSRRLCRLEKHRAPQHICKDTATYSNILQHRRRYRVRADRVALRSIALLRSVYLCVVHIRLLQSCVTMCGSECSVSQCVAMREASGCCNLYLCLCRAPLTYMHQTATHCNSLQLTATHCNTMQLTAKNCNTLQYTATQFNSLQLTAIHCNTLQHTAIHCNTLQHTAIHCTTLQHTATHCNTMQRTATHYTTLHHTAPHCITLQHTATHCNTLQHTATH